MENFKHKVQSQSGASMLMALFLLLRHIKCGTTAPHSRLI